MLNTKCQIPKVLGGSLIIGVSYRTSPSTFRSDVPDRKILHKSSLGTVWRSSNIFTYFFFLGGGGGGVVFVVVGITM